MLIQNTDSSTLNIAYINCVGQDKFTVKKQLEIQQYVKSNNIDILHLQECKTDDDSFQNCSFIWANFNIIKNNTPNNTDYGTASLVRCDIEYTNLKTDSEGRIIIFDAVGSTFGNFYLPSGTDGAAHRLRENYCSKVLPELLVHRQPQGVVGGDLNCIVSLRDSNRNPSTKLSPSLKELITSFEWLDSFRCLHPRLVQFSRVYSNARHGEGASRLDRSYHWGEIQVAEAQYNNISFSDHFSLLIQYTLPSPLDRQMAPRARPQFRISPEVVIDKTFQARLRDAVPGWQRVLEAGADTATWWQHLVKGGIRHLATERGRELGKQRKGQLNVLYMRQAHLGSQVGAGDLSRLTELTEINLRISQWYETESKRIILLSRAKDIDFNEKVRVYHHSIHHKMKQKSAILKLETPAGLAEGHAACALALEENVAAHLLHPAELDAQAQAVLLAEVEPCFTESDNQMLLAPATREEVKAVLAGCRSHAAPGTDGLTAYFYQKCWGIIGSALCEIIFAVFSGAKPSSCQRTSLMVFGNKPGKKAKSLKISDRRKLSMLNLDFKIITGIEAARIRPTMTRTISRNQFVTGGDRRISHGVALARDAVLAAGGSGLECGILDTDLIAAFCNMVATWCTSVMIRKGLDQRVVDRYLNLYSENFSIVVVNSILGRSIQNIRMSIRQGDKFAMELFTFGIDPVLVYLEKRLKGILIHSLPVQGPVLLPQPPPAPAPGPPPALPGLPALQPPPPPPASPQNVEVSPGPPARPELAMEYLHRDLLLTSWFSHQYGLQNSN
jgi:exonuclease III